MYLFIISSSIQIIRIAVFTGKRISFVRIIGVGLQLEVQPNREDTVLELTGMLVFHI